MYGDSRRGWAPLLGFLRQAKCVCAKGFVWGCTLACRIRAPVHDVLPAVKPGTEVVRWHVQRPSDRRRVLHLPTAEASMQTEMHSTSQQGAWVKGGWGRVQRSTGKSTCLNLEGALGVVAGDLPLLTLKHVSAATHGHLDL